MCDDNVLETFEKHEKDPETPNSATTASKTNLTLNSAFTEIKDK